MHVYHPSMIVTMCVFVCVCMLIRSTTDITIVPRDSLYSSCFERKAPMIYAWPLIGTFCSSSYHHIIIPYVMHVMEYVIQCGGCNSSNGGLTDELQARLKAEIIYVRHATNRCCVALRSCCVCMHAWWYRPRLVMYWWVRIHSSSYRSMVRSKWRYIVRLQHTILHHTCTS